jgi:aflatoxin B1 aldehyde reductase
LTGKLINNQHTGTRIDKNNPLGRVAQKIFGVEELHQIMRDFDTSVRTQGFTPLEVAVRWIAYHSALGDKDDIILGASKVAQLSDTVAFLLEGQLSNPVLPLVERLWNVVQVAQDDII